MEALRAQLNDLIIGLWWPFCRSMALFSAVPYLGDTPVPVVARVLLSLALAVILLPVAAPAAHIEPASLQAVAVTAQQLLIGAGIGFAFQLTTAAVTVAGFVLSAQLGLSMATMNDPINGVSSDAVSAMLTVLITLVFFSIDGHLVLTGVLGASFHAWPVGLAPSMDNLSVLAHCFTWIFSAALLLALPVIFSTLLVQMGFGLLNRINPMLNLQSLGFAAITLFGLFVLGYLLRFVPGHYVRLTDQVLDLLQRQFG